MNTHETAMHLGAMTDEHVADGATQHQVLQTEVMPAGGIPASVAELLPITVTGATQVVPSNGGASVPDFQTFSVTPSAGAKAMIEELVKDYKSFTTYKGAQIKSIKHVLYGLLDKCFKVYSEMDKDGTRAEKLCNEFDVYAAEQGHVFGKKTAMLSKVLQCVFTGSDYSYSRVSGYCTVINYAKSKGCKPGGLVQFIETNGGIQAIRRLKPAVSGGNSNTPATPTREATSKQARAAVASERIGVITDPAIVQAIPQGHVAEQILLVATPMADGTITINAALSDTTTVDNALQAYYRGIAKVEKEKAKAAKKVKGVAVAAADEEPDEEQAKELAEAMA